MKNFEYAAPRTEAEVLQLLSAEPGKTEILAGGTDLVDLMKGMIVTPDRVVNIMDVPSLKLIEELPDGGVSNRGFPAAAGASDSHRPSIFSTRKARSWMAL